MPQIYDILHKDHVKLQGLLGELIEVAEGDEIRSELIREIRDALIPHARAEEAVLYNSLRAMDEAKDLVRHSYKEHMEAEALLRTLQMNDKMDLNTQATAKNLRDAIEHHVQEEESKIFPAARQIFSEKESEMLASAFEQLKAEVRPEGFLKTTLDLVRNLMPPRVANYLKEEPPSSAAS